MICLYMDEHVPGPITRELRRRSVDVLMVQEDGRKGDSDQEILDRAARIGRVVFTTDTDFLTKAARRQRMGESFHGVIYIHQRKLIIGQCVEDLELIARASNPPGSSIASTSSRYEVDLNMAA